MGTDMRVTTVIADNLLRHYHHDNVVLLLQGLHLSHLLFHRIH